MGIRFFKEIASPSGVMPHPIDVEKVIQELTIEEKVQLLAGKDTWTTNSIDRLNIPSITVRGVTGARV